MASAAPERTVLIGKHGEAEEKEEGRKEGKRRNKVNEKIRAVLILTQKNCHSSYLGDSSCFSGSDEARV